MSAASDYHLTKEHFRQLNDIYANIIRKYRSTTSESIMLDAIPRLTKHEAAAMAENEIAEKREKVIETYNDRIANINENAEKRGLADSSITLALLDKASQKKEDALNRLNGTKENLTKKIMADNIKLALSVEKEKSTMRSRSIRDYVAVAKMRLTVPYNIQANIDQELYDSYFAWLTQFEPADAYGICNFNAIFYLNMGGTKWMELLAALNLRKTAAEGLA